MYDDYEDEEDGSDLADFIDDTELDDFQQKDLEETLKYVILFNAELSLTFQNLHLNFFRMINRNYDKKKWKMREAMIDERKMTSKFSDIEKEERRSAKMGIVEDMIQAKTGRSRAI